MKRFLAPLAALACLLAPLAAQAQSIDTIARGLALRGLPKTGGTMTGPILAPSGSGTAPSYSFTGNTGYGLYLGATSGRPQVAQGSSASSIQLGSDLGLASGSWLRWAAGTNADTSTFDLNLARDAAGVLGCRNGASACVVNIYKTFTDLTNYERIAILTGGTAGVSFENLGTGSARTIGFGSNLAGNPGATVFLQGTTIDFWTAVAAASPTKRWQMDTSGNFLAVTDKTYDIGDTTHQPRDVWVGRHMSSSGAAPAVTSCGTSPAIVGSDIAGEVTTGTATPTACTITFNVAYSAQPYCTVVDRSALANLTSYTVSTTAIVLTTSAASSQKVVYHCVGA